jgi:menaquinone-dependent protoporphyrinogen IX oxidase
VTTARVLIVYYTYTRQTRLVAEAMAEVLSDQGCDVRQAVIELTDRRYADRFETFPLPFRMLVGMLPAQLRHAVGEIQVPDEVGEGEYDLICIGSPTWWLTACLPIRSFLTSPAAGPLLSGKPFTVFVVCRRYWRGSTRTVRRLGTRHGGAYVEGIHLTFAGGQVRSLIALVSYLRTGRMRERLLGVRIPPTNLQPEQIAAARKFAAGLAAGSLPHSPAAR